MSFTFYDKHAIKFLLAEGKRRRITKPSTSEGLKENPGLSSFKKRALSGPMKIGALESSSSASLTWSPYLHNSRSCHTSSWKGEDRPIGLTLKKILTSNPPAEETRFSIEFLNSFFHDTLFTSDDRKKEAYRKKDDFLASGFLEILNAETYKSIINSFLKSKKTAAATDSEMVKKAQDIFNILIKGAFVGPSVKNIGKIDKKNLGILLETLYSNFFTRFLKDNPDKTPTVQKSHIKEDQYGVLYNNSVFKPVEALLNSLFLRNTFTYREGDPLSEKDALKLAKSIIEEMFENQEFVKRLQDYVSDHGRAEEFDTFIDALKNNLIMSPGTLEELLAEVIMTVKHIEKSTINPSFTELAYKPSTKTTPSLNPSSILEIMKNEGRRFLLDQPDSKIPPGYRVSLVDTLNAVKSISQLDEFVSLISVSRLTSEEVYGFLFKVFEGNLKFILEELQFPKNTIEMIEKDFNSTFNNKLVSTFSIKEFLKETFIIKCKIPGKSEKSTINDLDGTMLDIIKNFLNKKARYLLKTENLTTTNPLFIKDKNALIQAFENLPGGDYDYDAFFETLSNRFKNSDSGLGKILPALKNKIFIDLSIKIREDYEEYYKASSMKRCLNTPPQIEKAMRDPTTIPVGSINALINLAFEIFAKKENENSIYYDAIYEGMLNLFKTTLTLLIQEDDFYAGLNKSAVARVIAEVNSLNSFLDIDSFVKKYFSIYNIDYTEEIRREITQAMTKHPWQLLRDVYNLKKDSNESTYWSWGTTVLATDLAQLGSSFSFDGLEELLKTVSSPSLLDDIFRSAGDRKTVARKFKELISKSSESPRKKKAAIDAVNSITSTEKLQKFVASRFLAGQGLRVWSPTGHSRR